MEPDQVVVHRHEQDGIVFELLVSAEAMLAVKDGLVDQTIVAPVIRVTRAD